MLPGIHREFLDKSIPIFQKDMRIAGITAGGSYISGDMDEFSDIDLVIAVKPEHLEQVMNERLQIATGLGNLLSGFTGEHVGEPRLLICLYGPPLLHVDLKFVSLPDVAKRVEDPVILWERDNIVSDALQYGEAKFPMPNLQWIEDRFWVWVHYGATKIGRGEIFETIEFISFLRQNVIGPLLLMKNGKLPRGVRKIEFNAPDSLPLLVRTVPSHNAKSCVEALEIIIELYLELRGNLAGDSLEMRTSAEEHSRSYLSSVSSPLKTS